MNVIVHTGDESFNDLISSRIFPNLLGLNACFISQVEDAQVVITIPELLSDCCKDQLIILLTDDINYLTENDQVADIAPVPISNQDFEKIEWKLIRILDSLQDDA